MVFGCKTHQHVTMRISFFQKQSYFWQRSRLWVLPFGLAYLATIASMVLVTVLFAMLLTKHSAPRDVPKIVFFAALFYGTVLVCLSYYRYTQLSLGGIAIAKELNAAPIRPTSTEHKHRQLINIVEEVAIAANIPPPRLFVLEHEHQINALSAGYSYADHVIIVTQGSLDLLNCDEWLVLVGHEFSHIIYGDMLLNMSLLSLNYSLWKIGHICKKMLSSVEEGSRSSSDLNGYVFILLIYALVMWLVGGIGLTCTRAIQRLVFKNREFLADSKSVQLTRNSSDLLSLFAKIQVVGSSLCGDYDEFSHMLLAPGKHEDEGVTHPKLIDRLRNVAGKKPSDDYFTTLNQKARDAIKDIYLEQKAQRIEKTNLTSLVKTAPTQTPPLGLASSLVMPNGETSSKALPTISQVHTDQRPGESVDWLKLPPLMQAQQIKSQMNPVLLNTCYNPEQLIGGLVTLLLSDDVTLCTRQIQLIEDYNTVLAKQVVDLYAQTIQLRYPTELERLTYLELVMPQLASENLKTQFNPALIALCMRLAKVDDRIDYFEFLLVNSILQYFRQSQHPRRALHGVRTLEQVRDAIDISFDLLTLQPTITTTASNRNLQTLYRQFYRELKINSLQANHKNNLTTISWANQLQGALKNLCQLQLSDKNRLAKAWLHLIYQDGVIDLHEWAILRASCLIIGVPLITRQ